MTTTYTIRFDGAGGSPVPSETRITLTDYEVYSYTIPNITPTRNDNEYFKHWIYFDESGDGDWKTANPGNTIYINKATFYPNSTILTLTAEWEEDVPTEPGSCEVEIIYKAPRCINSIPEKQIIDANQAQEFTYQISNWIPIYNNGEVFEAWYVSVNDERQTIIDPNESSTFTYYIDMESKITIVFEAITTPAEDPEEPEEPTEQHLVTVRFNTDGDAPSPQSFYVNYGEAFIYTIPSFVPTKNGYKFSYWDIIINNELYDGGYDPNNQFSFVPEEDSIIEFEPIFNPIPIKIEDIYSDQSEFFVSDQAQLYIEADGYELSYQWQQHNGTSWSNITNNSNFSGATTSNLIIKSCELIYNNYKWRCIVTSLNGTEKISTDIQFIVVEENQITIITQPQTQTVTRPNQIATFKVNATGNNLSYRWQYFLSATSSWVPLIDNDTSLRCLVNGATTKELSFSKFQFGRRSMPIGNGTLPIRCLITSNNVDTLSTQEVELILNLPTTYIKTENGWKVAALFTKTDSSWKWGTALPKTSQGWE